MSDVFAELAAEITRFRDERNWAQFHTLKNLMLPLSIEAAELLEHWQWKDEEQIRKALDDPKALERHCQTNANESAKARNWQISGRELTPLCQRGGAIELEVLAAVEVTFLIEVVMNRRMDRGELL